MAALASASLKPTVSRRTRDARPPAPAPPPRAAGTPNEPPATALPDRSSAPPSPLDRQLMRAVAQRSAGALLQRHKDDLVAYTGGQSGTVGVFDAGVLVRVGPAISGHAGHGEWEVNVGPTPTGMYTIRPSKTRSAVTQSNPYAVCGAPSISYGYQEIKSAEQTPCEAGSAHYCNVPCPTAGDSAQMCWTPVDCWGPKRVRIEGSASVPKPGGGKQRRDGFYLHGGNPADPISSGCIKMLDYGVFEPMRKLKGTSGGRVRFCVGSACPPDQLQALKITGQLGQTLEDFGFDTAW